MKEEKNIDRLLRKGLKLEHPKDDFSDSIMSKIEAMDVMEEKALKSLLKRNVLESPSLNFTSRVMTQMENASQAIVDKPVIGKRAWLFISVSITSIFIFALFSGSSEHQGYSWIDGALQSVTSLMDNSITFEVPSLMTSPIFALSVFALSSLFFLDYFLRNTRYSLKI